MIFLYTLFIFHIITILAKINYMTIYFLFCCDIVLDGLDLEKILKNDDNHCL